MDLLTKTGEVIKLELLPEELQKKIQNYACIDILKDQAKEKIKAAENQPGACIALFLTSKSSEKTRAVYFQVLTKFIKWQADRGVKHILLTRAEHIDQYIFELKNNGMKNNTVRKYIACLSSFFKTMRRYRKIEVNAAAGATLPKKEYKKSLQPDGSNKTPIMNSKEYAEILKAIEAEKKHAGRKPREKSARLRAAKMLPAVKILGEHGLRIAALKTLTVNADHKGYYETKGGKAGVITLRDNNLQGKPFKSLPVISLQKYIERITSKLFKAGVIRHTYTAHDFRHYFAASFYSGSKDIVKLSRLLNHASIQTTDIYLQSISAKD